MTWISWLGVYHCQSLLNNENRKLVCLESLCYCGVTRHNKTEALLCLGRKRIFRNWFCPSHTPAVDHAGMWEWAVASEESSASLRLQGDISALALCPSMCFLLLGLGLWREHGWRKRIFRGALGVSGAVHQMYRAAGLPSPAVQGGRRGVEHNRECALLVPDTGSKWQRGGTSQVWGLFLIILVVTVLGNLHQLLCRQTSCEVSPSSQESWGGFSPPHNSIFSGS